MYLIIKKEKSEHLKHKVRELKELACEALECIEEACAEARESESRERSRYDEDYDYRERRGEYEDFVRDNARGRGSRGMRGGRY